MPDTISESAFAKLFKNDTPLLDVRAPIEYQRGAFPHVTNLPLLTDEERQAVGSKYKQLGRDAAMAVGAEIVSGSERAHRLQQWKSYVEQNPDALLYCFRGGLRSQIVQQWLLEQDVAVPRIEGGYKALRKFLIDTLTRVSSSCEFLIVAGKTGSGKTHLINKLSASIDLEGLANHRGSAFGRRVNPQPNQINFENSLAVEFLKLPYQKLNRVFLEDESRAIGSLSIPQVLHDKMKESSMAIVEESIDTRVDTILNDYIYNNFLEIKKSNRDDPDKEFADYLLSSLERIKKRLGTENYQSIKSLMDSAVVIQNRDDDIHAHRDWIRCLLNVYYDPMYDYQLNIKLQRVVFRGNKQEFLSWSSHIDRSIGL